MSKVPNVGESDLERARLAVLALEQRGERVTVRGIRAEAGIKQAAALAVARALRDGTLPPAAEGAWARAPWAQAAEAQRRAAEATELRAALHSCLELLADDELPAAVELLGELRVDLARLAGRLGLTPDELEGMTAPSGPAVSLGDWLGVVEAVEVPPATA